MADAVKTKTPEEWKEETRKRTEAGVVEESAIFLKKNFKMLGMVTGEALPDPSKISEEEYRRMAREAIEKREFSITPGGKPITLKAIDEKIAAQPDAKKTIAAMGATSIEQLVPNSEQTARIANTTADAVYANLGSNLTGGTSLSNAAQGAWSAGLAYINPWASDAAKTEAKDRATKTVAENFRTTTLERLKALNKADPAMRLFLTPENVGFTGKSVYESVIDPNAPADTRLKETVPAEISEAQRATIGQGIYLATYDATKKGIEEAREDGYKESGFMGSIAKFVGPGMANILISIVNFFVQMFGGKGYDLIPTDNEIHNASNVVSGAVRSVFIGNDVPKSPEDANKAVKAAVKEDLLKFKGNYPTLTEERMNLIAEKAGKGAEENYSSIPKSGGNMKDAVAKAKNKEYDPKTQESPDISSAPPNGFVPKAGTPAPAVDPASRGPGGPN